MSNKLTNRERDTLILAANGYTYKKTAERLGIAEQTVKNHLSSAFKRLEVNNRQQAFLELGWLNPPMSKYIDD